MNSVGFLRDFRRLNVAITRAKYALLMVGNAPALTEGEDQVRERLRKKQAIKDSTRKEAASERRRSQPQESALDPLNRHSTSFWDDFEKKEEEDEEERAPNKVILSIGHLIEDATQRDCYYEWEQVKRPMQKESKKELEREEKGVEKGEGKKKKKKGEGKK